jgi:hypothetical protein
VDQGSQHWFLEPFSADNSTYRIRQVDTDECITADNDYLDIESCRADNLDQSWNLGINGKATGLHALAVNHAMGVCEAISSSCTWKEDTANYKAVLDTAKCVSQVVQNKTSKAAQFTKTWSQSVGWENTLGGSVSLTVETGSDVGVVAVTLNLRPGEYGWITRQALLKQVTGTWTFNVGNDPWTQVATITLPAADGTDGMSSVLKLHTGTTIPAICP